MAEPTIEGLTEELSVMTRAFREADKRGDALFEENTELEQEMADLRNELLRTKELLRQKTEELDGWQASDLRIRWIIGVAVVVVGLVSLGAIL